jgi:hypothetical protein
MTLNEIANLRLSNQQISATNFTSPKDIVDWLGAMQAQDYAMSKWAIGSRLPGSTIQQIENALDKGEIIRTHLLRPTWHLVSADDVYWLVELTAPQIKVLMKSWNKELEIDQSVFTKCNSIIEKTLSGGKHLTREELMAKLKMAKIATDNNRASLIMLHAELDGIVCNGVTRDKKLTYALLDQRVARTKKLTRDEALSKLARKYFSSHCPATFKDFVWWSGLLVKDAKNALEMVKSDLVSETIDNDTYWFSNSFSQSRDDNSSVYLLPAFDEFIISYKDRSAALKKEYQNKAFTRNGIFRPLIVVNGQVTGLWKRTIKNDKVIVDTEFFHQPNKKIKRLIENTAEKYGRFLAKKVELK